MSSFSYSDYGDAFSYPDHYNSYPAPFGSFASDHPINVQAGSDDGPFEDIPIHDEEAPPAGQAPAAAAPVNLFTLFTIILSFNGAMVTANSFLPKYEKIQTHDFKGLTFGFVGLSTFQILCYMALLRLNVVTHQMRSMRLCSLGYLFMSWMACICLSIRLVFMVLKNGREFQIIIELIGLGQGIMVVFAIYWILGLRLARG